MNTRLFHNPDHLFEVFTTLTYSPDDSKSAKIFSQYPTEYSTEEILSQIPKFAYPCKYESNCVEHYTFVLTDGDAKFFHGFCRLSPEHNTIFCVLSRLPWFDIFYKLLNKLHEISNLDDGADVAAGLLHSIHAKKVPLQGDMFVAEYKEAKFSFAVPNANSLPTIPANRNLTEFYSASNTDIMINVFISVLNERRLLITSKKLSKVTACCHAVAALLYPCFWQHLFIPILPEVVLDFVAAPMPYIIGLHESLVAKARSIDQLSEVVVVDLDVPSFTSEHDDRQLMPPDVISSLKKAMKSTSHVEGDNLSRAFLRSLAMCIGEYRDGMRYADGIEFNRDMYVAQASNSERAWRERLVEQQYFLQFIEDRLSAITDAEGYKDEFEDELKKLSSDERNENKYKEFMSNVKKQGKKLRKQGQHKVIGLGKKVQDVTKKTYKDISARIKDQGSKFERSSSGRSFGSATKVMGPDANKASRYSVVEPIKSAVVKTLRRPGSMFVTSPPRPQNLPRVYPQAIKRESYDKALKYKPMSFDDDDIPPHCNVELMSDPDLQRFLTRSRSSGEVSHLLDLQSSRKHNSDERIVIHPPSEFKQVTSISVGGSPIPPARRKKQIKGETDSTDGFEDNFTDHILPIPPSSTVSRVPLINVNSEPDESNPDSSLADLGLLNSSATAQPAAPRVTSSSLLTDLAGLDLSPVTSSPVHPTQPTHVNSPLAGLWEHGKPNYNINSSAVIGPTDNVLPNRYHNFSASNPFATPNVMTPVTGSIGIGTHMNGQTLNSGVHVRSHGPPIPPRPAIPKAQTANQDDPFKGLTWD